MPARLHPGVYVEEIPSGARAIEAAGTSTAIFVGETERGPTAPTKIKGVGDYERVFGGYLRHDSAAAPNDWKRVTLRYALGAFFQNGGTTAYVLRSIPAVAATGVRSPARASSPGKWSDHVRVVFADSSDGVALRWRIFVIYTPPRGSPAIVERWDRLSATANDENYAPDVLLRSAYIRWDPAYPVAKPPVDIAGPSPTETAILALAGKELSGGTLGNADITNAQLQALLPALDEINDASLLVVPARLSDADGTVSTDAASVLDYAANRPKQDLFVVADQPRRKDSITPTQATSHTKADFGTLNKTDFGAVYFPWVEISDPVGDGRDPTVVLGPSGFAAGIYARTDQRRGVWKAPAGLEATVLGARKLEYNLLDSHQDELNPVGINALRILPAGGNVVWGARTMRPDTEWRYIPVRRTAIFLRSSIYNGIQWAVFEPNDDPLWAQLRLTIGGFMEQLFRQGAFAGKTGRDAFFVKCDSETTPEIDQISGIVNVLVGFAPLRPAEFVVVKLSQIVNQKA